MKLKQYFIPDPKKAKYIERISKEPEVKDFLRLSKKVLVDVKHLTDKEKTYVKELIKNKKIQNFIDKLSTQKISTSIFLTSQLALRLISLVALITFQVSIGLVILIMMLISLIGAVTYYIVFDPQMLKKIYHKIVNYLDIHQKSLQRG